MNFTKFNLFDCATQPICTTVKIIYGYLKKTQPNLDDNNVTIADVTLIHKQLVNYSDIKKAL